MTVRRKPVRRGITLIETSVACALSTLLIWLVAMSGIEFTRGAHLIAARAELMREADIAVAHIVNSLRERAAEPESVASGGIRIGPNVYDTADGRLTRDGEPVAWHVSAIDLADDTIVLTMAMPEVVENRKSGVTLQRAVEVRVEQP